jgi:hypothetical protein
LSIVIYSSVIKWGSANIKEPNPIIIRPIDMYLEEKVDS